MAADLEELAFLAAERALDKQERLLEEIRARTGVLLAAASIAASFLGGQAFAEAEPPWLLAAVLAAFVVSIGASVYALTPKRGFTVALSGPRIYERLYAFRSDLPEAHRRLTYDLQRFWDANDLLVRKIVRAYKLAVVGLVVEIAGLAVLVSGRLL